MYLPDPRQLKKVADYCRKNGITTFKCAEYEITIAGQHRPEPSPYLKRKAKANGKAFQQGDVPTDAPSPEELFFYSAGGVPDDFEPGDLPK